jgi:hypothetical protein
MRLRLWGGAHMHLLPQIRDTQVSWQSLLICSNTKWDWKELAEPESLPLTPVMHI